MRIARWSVAAVLVIVGGTACASEEPPVAPGSGGNSPSASVPAPSTDGGGGGAGYGHGGGGSGGSGGGGGGGASEVAVTQGNYVFSPSKVMVASGDTITVTNGTPSTPHTFTVTGRDIDVSVEPTESEEVEIDLPSGTYPFVCTFHEAQGMVGTLKVT